MCCLCLLAGCTTATKYKPVATTTPPVVFQIAMAEPPLEVMIHTVIVYEGPGAWKQRTLWDEYLVSVVNTGSGPLKLTGARLTDILGVDSLPGDDPWELEKKSAQNWRHYQESGLTLAMGTLATGGMVALAGLEFYLGSAAMGAASLAIIPVMAGGTLIGVQVINSRNRSAVEREFARRRLVLPVELQPGQRISGSLFFPQTPGPQALTFVGESGSGDLRLSMDLSLTPLSGLHMGESKGKP